MLLVLMFISCLYFSIGLVWWLQIEEEKAKVPYPQLSSTQTIET